MAQCEIEKDNMSEILIRLSWEMHYWFGKVESPSEAACPWSFLIRLKNKSRHRPTCWLSSDDKKTSVFFHFSSVGPEVSRHV